MKNRTRQEAERSFESAIVHYGSRKEKRAARYNIRTEAGLKQAFRACPASFSRA